MFGEHFILLKRIFPPPHPHSTYSRMDYFLVSRTLVSQVSNSAIGNIVMSDRAPADLVIATTDAARRSPRRRLSASASDSEDSCAAVGSMISEFGEFNEGSINDSGIMWGRLHSLSKGPSHMGSSGNEKRMLKLEKTIYPTAGS